MHDNIVVSTATMTDDNAFKIYVPTFAMTNIIMYIVCI